MTLEESGRIRLAIDLIEQARDSILRRKSSVGIPAIQVALNNLYSLGVNVSNMKEEKHEQLSYGTYERSSEMGG